MKTMIINMLDDISDTCEKCVNRECCLEDDCILYRLESVLSNRENKGIYFYMSPRGYGRKYQNLQSYTKEELIKICLCLENKYVDLLKEVSQED